MPANVVCPRPSQPRRSCEQGWSGVLCQGSPLVAPEPRPPAGLRSAWRPEREAQGREVLRWGVWSFSQPGGDRSTPAPAALGRTCRPGTGIVAFNPSCRCFGTAGAVTAVRPASGLQRCHCHGRSRLMSMGTALAPREARACFLLCFSSRGGQ